MMLRARGPQTQVSERQGPPVVRGQKWAEVGGAMNSTSEPAGPSFTLAPTPTQPAQQVRADEDDQEL